MAITKKLVEQHTARVLALPRGTRQVLLGEARRRGCWAHVDWTRIRDSLQNEQNCGLQNGDGRGKPRAGILQSALFNLQSEEEVSHA